MLEILYHDDHLVAVNKPSGLLVHRSMIDRRETEFAMQQVRDMIGRHVYPVHRLDKPTSGVLLFALSSEVARKMTEIFTARESVKEYLAVVRGYTPEQGGIDYPLREMLDKMTDRKARRDKEAQEAVTEYFRLGTAELPYPVSRYPAARYSLVRCVPKTGRKHQLRRHMKHIMHPIVGDTKHGRGEHNKLFREKFDCHRLLLHAFRFSFTHPVSGTPVVIEAGLDAVFADVVTHLHWNDAVKNSYSR
jgi:tRNA pseudouridine65 synthase